MTKLEEDAIRLLNGEIVISDYVKSAKQIKATVDYIRELPAGMTVKDWKQMHKISDSLVIGEQEDAPCSSSS